MPRVALVSRLVCCRRGRLAVCLFAAVLGVYLVQMRLVRRKMEGLFRNGAWASGGAGFVRRRASFQTPDEAVLPADTAR